MRDPAARFIVGGRAVMARAASTIQMGHFETEVMTQPDNLGSLVSLSGMWIDRIAERRPMKALMLNMDSSVSPRAALPNNGSKHTRTRRSGRGCHAARSQPMPCGCNSTHSLTIWQTSCAHWRCRRRSNSGR